MFSDIKRYMAAKGYRIFTNGKPNIVGIRSNGKVNTYCDRVFVWWTEDGKEKSHWFTMTTCPGITYLKKPLAGTSGTAILVPGQYIDCWELGQHRNSHLALIQTGGKVKVYRDSNRDDVIDCRNSTIENGYFGINLHRASTSDLDDVNSYSAGCQVWKYHGPHLKLMQTFQGLAERFKFRWFSYTLINMQEL